MSFDLPEEALAIREVARQFTASELIPLEQYVQRREVDRQGRNDPLVTPEEEARLHEIAHRQGLAGVDVPDELGGMGLTLLCKAVAIEEFNYSITPFRSRPESPNLFYLDACASPSQRERYLRPYAQGRANSVLALTESDAGSDVGGIRTRARKTDTGWVINGTKLWISWADTADFLIVIAVTDPELGKRGGMSAFIVDADTPGLSLSKPILTMGEQRPFEVVFDDVEVSDDALFGDLGRAFEPLTNRLGVRRVDIAARCVGTAQRLLDMMCDYALQRSTFGAPLAERQGIQFMIADSHMEMEACRLLVYSTAARLDSGVRDIRLEASTVKVMATEMLSRVVDRALQIHGAMGYSKELPIEYIYRNSRALRILEGPSEIHRTQIARLLLKARS